MANDYLDLFHDYKPSAQNGDQMKNLPANLAHFGFSVQQLDDLVSLPDYYGSNIASFIYLPKSILEDSDCHTFYRRYSPAAQTFYAYAQRAMTYRFLDTCEYLEKTGKLSTDVKDLCRTLLYSNLLGNRVVSIINFKNMYTVINKYDEKILRAHFFGNLMIMRALINWTYADYCSNLQDRLPEAREILARCSRATKRYSTTIYDTANALLPQCNYVFDRLYAAPSSTLNIDYLRKESGKDKYEPIQIVDGGKYDYFKATIEHELAEPKGKNFYLPEDRSQF